jgi:hypothetical protein
MNAPHYLFDAEPNLACPLPTEDVKITEHEDKDAAKAYFAQVLAGDELALEVAP